MNERSRVSAAVVVGLAALAAAMGIGRFALTPLLPMMVDVTLAQGSLLAASNYAGYLAGALWCTARPADPGVLARTGLAGVALFTFAMGVTESFGPWLALRFAAGVASALVLVGISAWALRTLSAAGKTQWSGVVFAGVGIGIAGTGAFVLLGGVRGLLSAHMWLTLGIASAVIGAATWGSLRPVAGEAKPATGPRSPFTADARRLIACYGTFGFGYIVPATYIPMLAKQALDDPVAFGMVWPAFGAAAAVSTLLASFVFRDFAPRRLWFACQLVMAAGVGVPALSGSFAALVVAAIAIGGTFMVVTMAGMQEARRIAGDAATPLMAAMTAAFAVGQLAGPIVVALLAGTREPLRVAGIAAALVLLAGAAGLVRNSTTSKEIRHG